MSEPILCECGGVLVEEVTDEGIRPVGGDSILPFRRSTDFLVCPKCMRDYSVHGLIDRAKDAEVIDLLEKMIERREQAPPA